MLQVLASLDGQGRARGRRGLERACRSGGLLVLRGGRSAGIQPRPARGLPPKGTMDIYCMYMAFRFHLLNSVRHVSYVRDVRFYQWCLRLGQSFDTMVDDSMFFFHSCLC